MLTFWLYILRCSDGSLYVGHTDNLDRRMEDHGAGRGGEYTANRRPVTLVWFDEFPTRDECLARERQLKGWSRAKKEALIAADWERVHELARGPESRARAARLRGAAEQP